MSWTQPLFHVAMLTSSGTACFVLCSKGHQLRAFLGSVVTLVAWVVVGLVLAQPAAGLGAWGAFFRSDFSVAFWCLVFGLLFLLFRMRDGRGSVSA
jgi:hypothetical protein